MQDTDIQHREKELESLRSQLAQKSTGKDRMLSLYRRGRMTTTPWISS